MKRTNKVFVLGLVTAAAVVSTGCGNYGAARTPQSTETSTQSADTKSIAPTAQAGTGTYGNCQTVGPLSYSSSDGSGTYSVCTQPDNLGKLKVNGKTSSASSLGICIYLGTHDNTQGGIVALIDPDTHNPIFKCLKLPIDQTQQNGLEFDFGIKTPFNAVFVVDGVEGDPANELMRKCILASQGGLDPNMTMKAACSPLPFSGGGIR
mgnify:CR=1 FL=1